MPPMMPTVRSGRPESIDFANGCTLEQLIELAGLNLFAPQSDLDSDSLGSWPVR